MEGLHPDFIERVQETLLVCAPFDDYKALLHLFVDARIHPWRHDIGYRPNSVGLIDEVHVYDQPLSAEGIAWPAGITVPLHKPL